MLSLRSRIYWSWLLLSLFFLYQYSLRLAPSVLCEPIQKAFGMDARAFGLLGAYYQYAYALMQIPVGLLADRIGVRKVALTAIWLCLGGTFLLTHTDSMVLAQLSRILVGIGSAAAFVSALKMAIDGFSKEKQGFFMGMTVTMGTVGGYLGAKILLWMMELFGWRLALDSLNCLGVFVWAGCFFAIPKGLISVQHGTLEAEFKFSLWSQIGSVLKTGRVWLYAFLAMGVYGTVSALSNLWGTPFLMVKFNWDLQKAGKLGALMHLGMAIGFFLIPWISAKFYSIRRVIRWSALLLCGLLSVLFYGNISHEAWVIVCLVSIGALAGAEVVCFSGVARCSTNQNSGMTLGLVNSINMLGGASFQQLIGNILVMGQQGIGGDSKGIYLLENYQVAMSVLVLVAAIAWLLTYGLPRDK